MKQAHTICSASISELKKNPTALLKQSEGSPIAILNHNVPAANLIPAETYVWLMERLDDAELARIVIDRAHEKADAVEMTLDEL